MKLGKKIFTILCDNIREEVGGKLSVMGIYGPKMLFKAFPTTIPVLSFLVFVENLQSQIPEIKVTLFTPKTDPIVLKLPPPPVQEIGGDIHLGFGFSPFRAISEGDCKMEVSFGDEKKPSIVHRFQIGLEKK